MEFCEQGKKREEGLRRPNLQLVLVTLLISINDDLVA